jgi:beta-phosphoglucomutase-like phosphatase (HAD superfamily)
MRHKKAGILIDFDGVISKNSIQMTCNFIHDFINRFTPIGSEYIENYIKVIASFPVADTVKLLFNALGIGDRLEQFQREFLEFDSDKNNFIICDDFEEFIEICHKNSIVYKVFSLATPERLRHIDCLDGDAVLALNNVSKADSATYTNLARDMGLNLKNWYYIDDNPMALRAGKLAGLITAMMTNNMYTEADYQIFKEFIDVRVTSFRELGNIANFR